MNRKAEEESKEEPNRTLVNDISTAIEFAQEQHGSTLANIQSLGNEITFDLLWALFAPNTMVYTTENILKEPQAMKLIGAGYITEEGVTFFVVKGHIIHHDGQDLGLGEYAIRIQAFPGAKKITSLEALPLSLHPNSMSIQDQLIARGRSYAQLLDPVLNEYKGAAAKDGTKVLLKFHVSCNGFPPR